MKKLLIAFLLLFFIKLSFAQTKDSLPTLKKNSVYLEIWGNSSYYNYYSLNYERFLISKKNHFALRIGFSALSGVIDFPLMVNFITGQKNNHFEIGAGVLTELSIGLGGYFATAFDLGYRYQKPNGRFLFRIDYTPTVNPYSFSRDFLRFGTSFGYCF